MYGWYAYTHKTYNICLSTAQMSVWEIFPFHECVQNSFNIAGVLRLLLIHVAGY